MNLFCFSLSSCLPLWLSLGTAGLRAGAALPEELELELRPARELTTGALDTALDLREPLVGRPCPELDCLP